MLARSLAPDFLLRERETFLRLGAPAGKIYAAMRLREMMGMKLSTSNQLAPGTRSLLFVCFGNIMRSPMAATMMRRELAKRNLATAIQVDSSGLHATPGNLAHPWALAASREMNMPLSDHRAQLVTVEQVEQADAIFGMDFQNTAELLSRFPHAREKIFLLGSWLHQPGAAVEIPDPYFTDQDGTLRCYELIHQCIRSLADELQAGTTHAKA